MRYRHTMILTYITLPICAIIRLIQIVFTIDSVTGFAKQQYTLISTLMTVIVFVSVITVSLLAYATAGVKPKSEKTRPILSAACMLLGGMLLYQTVVGAGLLKTGSWLDSLTVILCFLSAIVFFAYGVKNVYEYNMPPMIMLVPVLYYVTKLIVLFINMSKLALVTENVFLVFTNSILLLFLFELASFENRVGDLKKSHKKLFAYGTATVMMCATTSLSKLALILFSERNFAHADIADTLLTLAVALFAYVYITEYREKMFIFKKASPKHLG